MHDMSMNETIKYNKSGPARYSCRTDVWSDIEHLLVPFGKKCIVSGGVRARASIEKKLYPELEKAGIAYEVNEFAGESCYTNVEILQKKAEEFGADFIIGCGGGKSLDTAKYAAELMEIPVITIPTIAATCAATSSQIIVYTDEGEYFDTLYPRTNPKLVLCDPDVIMHAPRQYMISGIYDSIAKWYEGSASYKGGARSDIFDQMALAVAKMLKESYFEKAIPAMEAYDKKEMSQEFIDVVNMNIYTAATVQALGIKAVRNGVAHAVNNGLSLVPGNHEVTHGEKVAYGISVQLFLLNSSKEEKEELFGFYEKMGFTPSFHALNMEFSEESISAVAHKMVIDPLMTAKPFDVVSEEMIKDAMKELENYFAQ